MSTQSLRFATVNTTIQFLTSEEKIQFIEQCYLSLQDKDKMKVEQFMESPSKLLNTRARYRQKCDNRKCNNYTHTFRFEITITSEDDDGTYQFRWCEHCTRQCMSYCYACTIEFIDYVNLNQCEHCKFESQSYDFIVDLCSDHSIDCS